MVAARGAAVQGTRLVKSRPSSSGPAKRWKRARKASSECASLARRSRSSHESDAYMFSLLVAQRIAALDARSTACTRRSAEAAACSSSGSTSWMDSGVPGGGHGR